MSTVNEKLGKDSSSPQVANPYAGRERHPELQRLLDEGEAQRRRSSHAVLSASWNDKSTIAASTNGWNRPVPAIMAAGTSGAVRAAHRPPAPPAPASITAGAIGEDATLRSDICDGLAKLNPDAIIDKNQLASMFGISEKTIRRRMAAGKLPPAHMKMNRRPQWLAGLLLAWLKDRARIIAERENARRQHIRDKSE